MIANTQVTLYRHSVSGVDSRGSDILVFTPEPLTVLTFMPGASTETTQGAEQVVFDAQIFAPGGTNVSALDQIEYPVGSGNLYEVQGDPDPWASPLLANSGSPEFNPVVINLKKITGAPASK